MNRRTCIAVACAAAVVTGTAPARAASPSETPSVRLEWTAPAECVDAASLGAAVSAQLGRPAFDPSPEAELRVRGAFERNTDGRHRVRLALSTRAGEPLGVRVLDSDNRDCRSLDDALVVTLALMLDVRRTDIQALAPVPVWTRRAAVTAGVIVGLLPRPGLEATAGVGVVRAGRVSVDVSIAFDGATRAGAAEGTILVGAIAPRVGLGVVVRRGAPDLRLRLSGGVGPMWADAGGFPQVFTQTRAFADVRAGALGGFHLGGRLWAEVGVEAGVVPLRPTFSVSNVDGTAEPLFRPRFFVWSAALGLAFRTK